MNWIAFPCMLAYIFLAYLAGPFIPRTHSRVILGRINRAWRLCVLHFWLWLMIECVRRSNGFCMQYCMLLVLAACHSHVYLKIIPLPATR